MLLSRSSVEEKTSQGCLTTRCALLLESGTEKFVLSFADACSLRIVSLQMAFVATSVNATSSGFTLCAMGAYELVNLPKRPIRVSLERLLSGDARKNESQR